PLSTLGRDFALEPGVDGTLAYRSERGTVAGIRVALAGAHQRDNAALAIRALECAPALACAADAVRAGLARVAWPGRLQVVQRDPLVLLDGAHNGPGIAVVAAEVQRLAAGRPLRVLFGVMADKDWRTMLGTLGAIASEIVLTRPRQPRSTEPAILAAAAPAATVVSDPADAYRALVRRSAPGDVVLVTGSLFLVADVLAAI